MTAFALSQATKSGTVIGKGSATGYLTDDEVKDLVYQTFTEWDLTGQKVLVIVPDGTRTMPMSLMFRTLFTVLSGKVRKLDYLVALGTHMVMDEDHLNHHFGISAGERSGIFKDIGLYNHEWSLPDTFAEIGLISAEETRDITDGMLSLDVPVKVNRMVLDYDVIVICGPVFPHEVVGFSGGNKYFFPGISGPEVINFTHWLGALITNFKMIGTKDTPVRQVINRAASFINKPKLCLALVVIHDGLSGLYAGTPEDAWAAASDLSAQIHVKYVDKPYKKVLSVMPKLYDDIWTGAKGMYKMEPVVVDGGEVIIYAPHITEVSYTHGKILDEVGYHVRDYFVKQWDQFKHYPWGVLAHSTHVKGMGSYENGVERPRIQVTLATGVSKERCEKINLGYRDPATIRMVEWEGREREGILLVPKAGEILYRLKI
jgi:nickel-dependent lactate racemase